MVRAISHSDEDQPTILSAEQQPQPGILKDFVVVLQGASHFKIVAVKAESYEDLQKRLQAEGQVPHFYGIEHYTEINPVIEFQPITVIERK